MSERWRFYLAGAMQSAGAIWIAGWGLSHWVASLSPVFGPMGWLPVSVGLTLLGLSGRLLYYRVGGDTPNQALQQTEAARLPFEIRGRSSGPGC